MTCKQSKQRELAAFLQTDPLLQIDNCNMNDAIYSSNNAENESLQLFYNGHKETIKINTFIINDEYLNANSLFTGTLMNNSYLDYTFFEKTANILDITIPVQVHANMDRSIVNLEYMFGVCFIKIINNPHIFSSDDVYDLGLNLYRLLEFMQKYNHAVDVQKKTLAALQKDTSFEQNNIMILLNNTGYTLELAGRYRESIEYYNRSIQLRQKSENVDIDEINNTKANRFRLLARYLTTKKLDTLLKDIDLFIKHNKDEGTIKENQMHKLYMAKSILYKRRNDLSNAMFNCNRAIKHASEYNKNFIKIYKQWKSALI